MDKKTLYANIIIDISLEKLDRTFQYLIPEMLADLVVVTTDNPREEDPEKIADEICLGLGAAKGKYGRIPDREQAIAYGISHAKPGDIVVIAGKGHETYQEINGEKYPMDDRKLAMKCKVW